MVDSFESIYTEIMEDKQNHSFTEQGIFPLYSASSDAKIVIIGQAPGQRAQDTRIFWNDRSGDRLREWLGVSREEFYESNKLAILPMDFYFPGKGKSGDLPPRKGFAEKWHPRLLALMPNVQLTILIGTYATKYYLKTKSSDRLTEIVHEYQHYLPDYFPIVHPSPRNQIWMAKNRWFETDVLPDLKKRVHTII
ncbi:MAG: uracil-DNA glycosylase family protein [Enterococcus sp.]